MIRSQIVTSSSKPCRRIHPHWRCFTFVCTFISFAIRGNGFTMAAANLHSSKTTKSPVDPRESGPQLRPGLWQTINEPAEHSGRRHVGPIPQGSNQPKPFTAEIKTEKTVYFKPCLLCLTNTCSSTLCRD